MDFDILKLFHERLGENYDLHSKIVNPAWWKVSKLTGYRDHFHILLGNW